MHQSKFIKSVESYIDPNKILVPEEPGVYAFWWIADKHELLNANRSIILSGPNKTDVKAEYRDWWPKKLKFPCLYVGKSTNLKKRFSQHLLRKSLLRAHPRPKRNRKNTPRTTSCQVRAGIDHIFPEAKDTLSIVLNKVGYSYSTEFSDNAVAERFFMEDLRIGQWRPWFNLDSER